MRNRAIRRPCSALVTLATMAWGITIHASAQDGPYSMADTVVTDCIGELTA